MNKFKWEQVSYGYIRDRFYLQDNYFGIRDRTCLFCLKKGVAKDFTWYEYRNNITHLSISQFCDESCFNMKLLQDPTWKGPG